MCSGISSIKIFSVLIELNNQRISSTKQVLSFNRTNLGAHTITCAIGLVRLNLNTGSYEPKTSSYEPKNVSREKHFFT